MNEIDENILSILSSILSPDNKLRQDAERFYSLLERNNPEKLVNSLLTIIESNKTTFESLLALIHLSHYIEDIATGLEINISTQTIQKIKDIILSIFSDDAYPKTIREYALSLIENYIYITNGNHNDWPELLSFFFSLLKEDPKVNNNKSYFNYISISFFTFLSIVRSSDDFDSILYPHINLSSADECERVVSLKYLLISLYHRISADDLLYLNQLQSTHHHHLAFVKQIPVVLKSLSPKYFSPTFSVFWKVFKKQKKVFSDIIPEISGLLLTNVADSSQSELFRRDSLFFFCRLFTLSKKTRKLFNDKSIEIAIKIISSCLQSPNLIDLYYESQNCLRRIFKIIPNDQSIIQKYCEQSNEYISSFFISFFNDETLFLDKIYKNIQSQNPFLKENGLYSLQKRIKNIPKLDFGLFLFQLINQSHLTKRVDHLNKIPENSNSSTQTNQLSINHQSSQNAIGLNSIELTENNNYASNEQYSIINGNNLMDSESIITNSTIHSTNGSILNVFCYWCKSASCENVAFFYPQIQTKLNLNQINQLYCASIICSISHSDSMFVLKPLMHLHSIDTDSSHKSELTCFDLSILSNCYQSLDPTFSEENFGLFLPLILRQSNSIDLINSTPFLEIMEIIGYKFVRYLDSIIHHIFVINAKNQSGEIILESIGIFEKIVSLFRDTNFLDSHLDSILTFAIFNSSIHQNSDKNPISNVNEFRLDNQSQTDIELSHQIRLESITLLALLLQNNWTNKIIYEKCLQFVMTQIPSESSLNCLKSLFNLVLLFIDHEKELNSENQNDCCQFLGMTKFDILNYFLSYIPFSISKAIESVSEELYATAASIFVLLLKRIPNETTELFFEIQQLIPRYSITSPPVTPPSSFSSPFSRNRSNDEETPTTVVNDNDNSNELRCFSLMIWTDFVTYGPPEHTAQYEKGVIEDLKFFAERITNHSNKNEEHFRKIAIICLYSYYTSFAKESLSELKIDSALDAFYRIAAASHENSIDIIEIALAGYSLVFRKFVTEKNFPMRTKQFISLLQTIQRQTDESDTAYLTIFHLIVFCINNPDLNDYLNDLIRILKEGLDSKFVSDEIVEDLVQKIICLNERAPTELRNIIIR